MPSKNQKLDQFETQLQELESLVRELETGEVPLEKAVAHFERGMSLSQNCEKLLSDAELKVEKLISETKSEPRE